jgi:hypothetical protein
MGGGNQVAFALIRLSHMATPIEPPEIRLTQIGRQIRDLWYHYVRVPYETFFR